MKKLGYILTKNKVNNIVDFVSVIKDISEIDDTTKPLLIVGLHNAKIYSKNFSILNKKIDNNIFWTFGKTERRVDYEKDLESFYTFIINKNINNLKYYYVNILSIKYNKAKNLLNLVNSKEKKYIYISNNMIYIFNNKTYILGISLKILNYININIKKIYKLLYSNKSNVIYNNDSFLTLKMKKLIENKRYVIPYFISILDDE